MQRWTFAAFSALFAAAVIAVLLQARRPVHAPQPAAESTSVAPPPAAQSGNATASSAPDAGVEIAEAGAFDLLPNGKPVPSLPATAPKIVGFGAILFAYKGVQSAPKDAPTRQQAFEKAKSLIRLAKKDFKDAVKHGDPGSTADAGHIPRGVLEPAVEYILFTLPKGGVYDQPVDTPRGYWVLRRND